MLRSAAMQVSGLGVTVPTPLNSFKVALAKKEITSDNASTRLGSGSPGKALYFADLNGFRLTLVHVSSCFIV